MLISYTGYKNEQCMGLSLVTYQVKKSCSHFNDILWCFHCRSS